MSAARRVLLPAIACAALASIGSVAFLFRAPEVPLSLDARIAAAEARRTELLRDRMPLQGDGVRGCVAEHCANAVAALERSEADTIPNLVVFDCAPGVSVFADGETRFRPVSEDKVARHRAAIAPAIAELQIAAQCRDASRCTWGYGWLRCIQVAQTEVMLRLAEGDHRRAVELWLDMQTLFLDYDWSPWLDLHRDAVASLTDEAAALLDAGLVRLEGRLPVAIDVALSARIDVRNLREAVPFQWSFGEAMRAWDHGFDPSSRRLAAFDAALAYAEVLEPAATAPDARDAQWQLFTELVSEPADAQTCLSFWSKSIRERDRYYRIALSTVRSLRIGVAARLGRELPKLIDPTTDAPFRVDEDGATIVVHREPPAKPQRWIRCP